MQILSHSDHFVTVNKPCDVKVNSDDPAEVTVETLLRQCGVKCRDSDLLRHSYYWIHRLDYATSGVLCIGLTKQAARFAQRAFEGRLAKKSYIALVRGHVDFQAIVNLCTDVELSADGDLPQSLRISPGLIRDRTTDFPFKFAAHSASCHDQHNLSTPGSATGSHRDQPNLPTPGSVAGSQRDAVLAGGDIIKSKDKVLAASTSLYILDRGLYDADEATRVLLVPHTGRSHQLRVHCKHIGHAIVGDYTYSDRQDVSPHRMMLHSYSLFLPASGGGGISLIEPVIVRSATDPFVADHSLWTSYETHSDIDEIMGQL